MRRTTTTRSWAFPVSATVLTLAALSLLCLPLFNTLGYEFSTAIALILPVVIGPFVVARLRARAGTGEPFGRILYTVLRPVLMLAALPLVLAALAGLFVKNCSMQDGLSFYMLIPVVTAVWLTALAVAGYFLVRRALFFYFSAVILVLLVPLAEGYFLPQIYSYNFIYGYFPGISYDEALPVRPTLVFFRGITLLTASALFILAHLRYVRLQSAANRTVDIGRRGRIARYGVLGLVAVVLVVCWVRRCDLGLETTGSYLRQALGARLVTPHFFIYYQSGSVPDSELWRVAAEHEFRYSQIASVLGTRDERRITSYLYPDPDAQYRLLGTRTTNIAKPWLREIHLTLGSWDLALKHELVHAMAGEFGMPVIHAHYNIGLVEGLATAVDDSYGNRSIHEYAAAITRFHIADRPEELISPVGFALHSSGVSYLLMGSFCRFLIDRFGIDRFRSLYGGASPAKVYLSDYRHLITAWEEMLDSISVPPSWEPHAAYLFRRPSIFAKVCGRKIAELNDEADRKLAAGDPADARKIFSAAYELSRNSDSYAGVIRSVFAMEQYDTVTALIARSDSSERESLRPLFRLAGDASWADGDTARAAEIWEQLAAIDLSDRFNESLQLRLAAMRDPAGAVGFRKILVGHLTDSVKILLLDSLERSHPSPLVRYFRGRLFLGLREYDRARKDFDFIPPRWSIPLFDGIREQSLGRIWFAMGEYERARAHFWESLNSCPTAAERREVDDWIDRCDWYERHAPPHGGNESR